MLLVVIFVLLGNVRHIGFVAWLIGRHIGFRHIGFRHMSFLYVTSLVKYDSYGFELSVLVNMMAELRFYLKCVDFRSGWHLEWPIDPMI